jgi:hypothetical protein
MSNGQLKNWGILSQAFYFRHQQHISLYVDVNVIRVCAVVTQLTVENSQLLCEVEYEN